MGHQESHEESAHEASHEDSSHEERAHDEHKETEHSHKAHHAKKASHKEDSLSRQASWDEVRDRLNRLSVAHLKRSLAVLGITAPAGGKDKLVARLMQFLQTKEKEKLKMKGGR